jgi:hypothetical protein
VSRRKRDTRDPTEAAARAAGGREPGRTVRDPAPDVSGRGGGRILRDLAVLLLAFGAGVGIAELFGAANLGVAFGVGQIVFAIALVVILTRG